ncbi:hypothetical protein Nepgr_013623 [Nepenthes gracilis]|uniref:Cytochrome P450 n=1 Tax=Nepenthes gracilis TaxID=150966 RepID=A0AAD3SIR1_NEPGR|nr:hypothetical protein Nepgr_013623 [Nepenthes gracilis]
MELLLLCLPYLLLGFVFSIIFSLQVLFSKHKSLFSAASLPPGTYGWPIIGESLEFVSAGWKGHPQRFIHDRMNKFSRECFKTSILGEPVAVMCRAAGNKFLFSNEGKLVTGWWPDSVKKIFPARSDKKEDVKRMRKLIPQFLKPEALKSYIGIMDTIAQGHFASAWENKEEVAVFPLAKQYTFWLACRLFMSMKDPIHIAKLADRFNMLTSGVMTLPIDLPGTPFNRAIKASDIIRKQLRKIIKQRRIDLAEAVVATPTHDILAHMVTTTDSEGCHMNDFEIADKILGLLIGGHDTTSVAITSIVRYLAELPHVYNMVYKGDTFLSTSLYFFGLVALYCFKTKKS